MKFVPLRYTHAVRYWQLPEVDGLLLPMLILPKASAVPSSAPMNTSSRLASAAYSFSFSFTRYL